MVVILVRLFQISYNGRDIFRHMNWIKWNKLNNSITRYIFFVLYCRSVYTNIITPPKNGDTNYIFSKKTRKYSFSQCTVPMHTGYINSLLYRWHRGFRINDWTNSVVEVEPNVPFLTFDLPFYSSLFARTSDVYGLGLKGMHN